MEKNKKTCKYLYYVEHFLILISRVTACVSIPAFASLGLSCWYYKFRSRNKKICAITAGITKYMSIVNKTKKSHDKIVLLRKDKLNTIEVSM